MSKVHVASVEMDRDPRSCEELADSSRAHHVLLTCLTSSACSGLEISWNEKRCGVRGGGVQQLVREATPGGPIRLGTKRALLCGEDTRLQCKM